jgi:hypothetical protein
MFKRNRRILWLLNHKTLMPAEAGLLTGLGYEVFTPKVLPPSGLFRNAVVDAQWDQTLSLPRNVLDRLNAFDFYGSEWPDQIVADINRYFGTVFVIPVGIQLREALAKFEGQVLFRAFGLDNLQSYKRMLGAQYGPRIFADIDAVGDRFWFAQGYEQLTECEPPLIGQQSIFLPVGMPDTRPAPVNDDTRTDQRILFVCPNIVTSTYYADVYQAFKRDFGDLPHVIVGVQDVPVDDPHVAGFVSQTELDRLYRECAVMYYHSRERRHVHYSPVEAAVRGMPVVYYADSLLGRLTPGVGPGRCATTREARWAIEQILAGDAAFTAQVRDGQHTLPIPFSRTFCEAAWAREWASSGLGKRLAAERPWRVVARELRRWRLRSRAHGLHRLPDSKPRRAPAHYKLVAANIDPAVSAAMSSGIDFRESSYPWFVADITGVSFPEPAGRWTDGGIVGIDFVEPLPARFRVVIRAGAFGENLGADVVVRIDGHHRTMRFNAHPGAAQEAEADWRLPRRPSRIEIQIPFPTTPEGDSRALGLALESLRVVAIEEGELAP